MSKKHDLEARFAAETATTVKEPSKIELVMNDVSNFLIMLEKSIEKLCEKLLPISSTLPAENGTETNEKTQEAVILSPIVQRITDYGDRIDKIDMQIQNIINRVEL